jgi:hypothetical protein
MIPQQNRCTFLLCTTMQTSIQKMFTRLLIVYFCIQKCLHVNKYVHIL